VKRIISALLSIVLAAGLFCSCTSEDPGPYIPTGDGLSDVTVSTQPTLPPEQSLTLTYYPQRALNPYTATDYTNRVLFSLLYQSLFFVDGDYHATPILCQTYSISDDMKTYTFQIAPALFSDGTSLTAADVVASLNAAKAGAYYSGRFQHILSIYEDNGSVVIQLDTPFENLPLLLDIPIVKASQVDAAEPLGTGPYVMDNSLSGRRLRRQAGWWCSSSASMVVTAAYIPLTEAQSPSQIRDQFEFEDLGLVCADPGSDTYADYRCDFEIWNSETGLFLYLGCNAASPIFSNDTVRAALTHAINRDYLVESFYRDFAHSACLPASPLSPYYDAALASRYGYDSEKFVGALTEANLQGAAVTLLLNSDDSLRVRVGRAIGKMLTACGLEVTILEKESADFIEHLRWGEYDLYLAQTKLSPNMDLSAFFQKNGSLNYGGLSDAAIYAISLEALANSGNYYNLHEMVMEDAQICPILFRSYAIYATRGLVTELTPARDNVFYYTLGTTQADALN